MNGFNFVADTNFLIAVHEGKENVRPFLDGSALISVISEVELLGWYKIPPNESFLLRSPLDDRIPIELNSDIRALAISLRQQVRIKTPDAIIAATSQYLQIPLVTADRDFKNVPGIELILL